MTTRRALPPHAPDAHGRASSATCAQVSAPRHRHRESSGNVSAELRTRVCGWGGMFLARLRWPCFSCGLTQSLAELARRLPDAGGFDGYVRRLSGRRRPIYGDVGAIALAVGAGLPCRSARRMSLGLARCPAAGRFKLVSLSLSWDCNCAARRAVGPDVRGRRRGALILIGLLRVHGPGVISRRGLFGAAPDGTLTLLPHGLGGAARCIPFALFLILGVEQAGHAAAEMRGMAQQHAQGACDRDRRRVRDRMCVLLMRDRPGRAPIGRRSRRSAVLSGHGTSGRTGWCS